VPEQDYPPPRRPVRSYRPDRDAEEPPPWANLPARPVGTYPPAGGGAIAGPGRPGGPGGRHAGPGGGSGGYTAARRAAEPVSGPRPDEPVPRWAGPDADRGEEEPAAPPRAPGGRALRAAARRRRRWLVMGGGVVVVAAAVLTVVLLAGGRPGPATVTPGALITTFQPGELQQVPDACRAVPAGTVQQYLPGKASVASPLPVDGSAGSACDWTIDQPPVYRLMEVNLLAYAPNGLASGDGSATFAAIDAYDVALKDMQVPPKRSPAPRATVQVLSGLGNQAFSAMQVFRVGGAVSDVATVVVRYRNVVVTVTLNGLEHSNRGNYGPVSEPQLTSAALAFARAAEASLR
jgi:hypothetical protein